MAENKKKQNPTQRKKFYGGQLGHLINRIRRRNKWQMGQASSNSSSHLSASELEELRQLTYGHFTKEQLSRHHATFMAKYPTGTISGAEFVEENLRLNGASKRFWENMFFAFLHNQDDMLTYKDYVKGYSTFSKGTPEEKLTFTFKMMDRSDKGYLHRHEVFELIYRLNHNPPSIEPQGNKPNQRSRSIAVNFSSAGDGIVDKVGHNKQLDKVGLEEFIKAGLSDPRMQRVFEMGILRALMRCADPMPLVVQDDIQQFQNQVAGHKGNGKIGGILKMGDKILKPWSEREWTFYEGLRTMVNETPSFFPKFEGRTVITDPQAGSLHYIIMEDLTYGYDKPCIMDIKMGRRSADHTAGFIKKGYLNAVDSYSTSSSLGFRICGMKVWQTDTKDYLKRDKPWGVSLKPVQIKPAFLQYVTNTPGGKARIKTLQAMIGPVKQILKWFKKQTDFSFIGSSILFIYDATLPVDDPGNVLVKIVDFAHTWRVDPPCIDTEYIHGLNHLLKIMGDLESDLLNNISLEEPEDEPEETYEELKQRLLAKRRTAVIEIDNTTNCYLHRLKFTAGSEGETWTLAPPTKIAPGTKQLIATTLPASRNRTTNSNGQPVTVSFNQVSYLLRSDEHLQDTDFTHTGAVTFMWRTPRRRLKATMLKCDNKDFNAPSVTISVKSARPELCDRQMGIFEVAPRRTRPASSSLWSAPGMVTSRSDRSVTFTIGNKDKDTPKGTNNKEEQG